MKQAETAPTYILLVAILLLMVSLHVFGLFPLATDKFSIFLISLLAAVLLLPLLKHLKFFDLVELRREYKLLKKSK